MHDTVRALTALIFAAETPLSLDRLSFLLEMPRAELTPLLTELKQRFAPGRQGFYLAEVAGGYQFRSDSDLSGWLAKLHHERPPRFSPAALETLAIIAYRQPITRAEVEYLRGVDSGGVLRTLLERNFVRILGKKDVPGRPLMYGTHAHFLEFFGLNSLNDLPTLKEFSALDAELAQESLAADGPLTPTDGFESSV